MQLTEAWLRELVNPPVDTAELVSQLTMAGLEVDAVTPVAAEFSGVVVAEVLSTEQHPNADKLRICQVNIGQPESLQIVCGASNVRPGLKVPAALIGALLPGDFKIKESKLRGELSFGMLCSEKELGLAISSEGLMELPSDAPVGVDIREYLTLNDQVIELGLTPNRADCLSLIGVAREVAVLNRLSYEFPNSPKVKVEHAESVSVSVEDSYSCPVYFGRLIKNINQQALTPLWMQERLRRCGIRSLSPVVDVTNYVLLELGQPLHAFDAAKLAAPIVVRQGREGESLTLLNEQTIQLDADVLVIADQKQALALAGVMGGLDTAVTASTTDIFLECAYFSPISLAGKARKFGLHTDSSHRFERGVDFSLQTRAIERATQLILDISGGIAGPVTEVIATNHLPARNAVTLRRQSIQKVLGIELAKDYIRILFEGLGMQVTENADGWDITPPSYRFDVSIEEDLLEEIARIYGYNNLPMSSLLMRSELGKAPEAELSLTRLQDCLVDRGYQEAITYSFVDESIQGNVAPDDEFIALQNPISSELSVMRTTLWCGLLNAALYNLNRQQTRIRLFETGLRFLKKQGELIQEKMLSGLALGTAYEEQWMEKSRDVDFFDVKADLEAVLGFSMKPFLFKACVHPALHPGQAAEIVDSNGLNVGFMGMLHPNLEKKLGFNTPVFLFELKQEAVFDRKVPQFSPLSKFPSVRRDLALLVKEVISAQEIIDCVNSLAQSSIREVSIFDVYQGKGIEEGYKSIALSLVLQDFSQTLTDTEIDAIFSDVLESLTEKLNAKLRE